MLTEDTIYIEQISKAESTSPKGKCEVIIPGTSFVYTLNQQYTLRVWRKQYPRNCIWFCQGKMEQQLLQEVILKKLTISLSFTALKTSPQIIFTSYIRVVLFIRGYHIVGKFCGKQFTILCKIEDFVVKNILQSINIKMLRNKWCWISALTLLISLGIGIPCSYNNFTKLAHLNFPVLSMRSQ